MGGGSTASYGSDIGWAEVTEGKVLSLPWPREPQAFLSISQKRKNFSKMSWLSPEKRALLRPRSLASKLSNLNLVLTLL